ncbi:unnamed protein product [Scytosiphon promiscuus]
MPLDWRKREDFGFVPVFFVCSASLPLTRFKLVSVFFCPSKFRPPLSELVALCCFFLVVCKYCTEETSNSPLWCGEKRSPCARWPKRYCWNVRSERKVLLQSANVSQVYTSPSTVYALDNTYSYDFDRAYNAWGSPTGGKLLQGDVVGKIARQS